MTSFLTLLPFLCLVCITAGHTFSKRLTAADVFARHLGQATTKAPPPANECPSDQYYRSANGKCNNLENPSWGAVGQRYQRLLDPVYDDDVMTPRQRGAFGDYLPSARDVSVSVHDYDFSRPHPNGTVMLMEWGQFLAHDLAGTPVDSVPDYDPCCYDNLVIYGRKHPDVDIGGPCDPIIISGGDRYFTEVSTRCMEFVRSFPANDENGVRQQVNERSAYIDGGQIYGTSDQDMYFLRTRSGGQMLVADNNNLPKSDDNYCVLDDGADDDYCMEAGDSRVNVYPGVGALHTIFVRFHNHVARKLAQIHTASDDELLFQLTRQIVIAVLQRITYNEYLPMILGPDMMSAHGLTDEFVYDDSCDATLYNVFAAAAFRFGHSMVPNTLTIDEEVDDVDLYDRPGFVLKRLDSLVTGLVTKRAEKADRMYSPGITDHLFELVPQHGFDIASLNIQRGRDHGLPPYNWWRQHCGLDPITEFDDLKSSWRFDQVYDVADDIDLYSGALDEDTVSGGTVGETYACLLGQQFANLRNCDRFWWETKDPFVGFGNDWRRNEIKRTKLSHIICLTTSITEIQENVFGIVDDSNPLVRCETLLKSAMEIDLF